MVERRGTRGLDFAQMWGMETDEAMRKTTDRIVTTHTGSLPRPGDLLAPLQAKDGGESYDAAALSVRVRESVAAIVRRQAEIGIDIVSDGEHSKSSFTAYLGTRLSGLSRASEPYQAYRPTRDALAFPGVYAENRVMLAARPRPTAKPGAGLRWLRCSGPISYVGQAEVAADIANLKAAMAETQTQEGFITALSPSNLEVFYRND